MCNFDVKNSPFRLASHDDPCSFWSTKGMGTYTFLDTDAIIEKVTKMTIPEIFEKEGEEGFRSVESQILDSVHVFL